MPRSLYLIDGHAQVYRAYYAPFGNLNAPTGEPTRATHVFFQMLLNLVRGRKPDYLVMVTDVSDETVFRKDIYADYKSHRDPPPEDLPVQFDRVLEILRAARIPILRCERFEADDIMATLARRLAGPALHVYLVSKDKDLEQLLGPHVSLFDPAKDEVITPEALAETKGWRPEQAIEAQVLIGDSVDNVPGVPGVGPKTAAKLIQKYGGLAAIIEHADELSPKLRESLLAFRPQVEMVRKLVTLRDDVPIEFDLDAARCERFSWSAMRPLFEQLGFRRLPEQLPPDGAESATGRDAEPFRVSQTADRPSERAARDDVQDAPPATSSTIAAPEPRVTPSAPEMQRAAARLREPDMPDCRLVNTPDALRELAAALVRQPSFAVDTETTGVNPVDAELVGMSFAWEVGRGYYVPVRSVFGEPLPLPLVREQLAPILADERTVKVGHNIKYDMVVLRNAGIPLRGPLFDTMIAAFVLDPGRSTYKMDALVEGLIGHRMIPITDLIGKGRDQITMDQVPLERVCEYAAEDADYTWRMKELFEPQLRGAEVGPLFYETEMPLVAVLAEMEFNGIRIDADYLAEMSRQLAARTDALVEEIQRLAGARFNPDSTKQLAEVLFDKLGFRVVKTTRTARSTDAETLETLARENPDAPLPLKLLEYREIQKLRGTYVDALPAARCRRTGRIHTSYHQTGAITGRLSSSEPNLQNIPIRTELGRLIRRAFVPRTADERLIVADYSQIELRVLAHFSEDEELIRAFHEDRDIHAYVAAQVNGVALEAVTKEMRARAKAVNFGIVYGQTAHGLAQATGMSRTDAQAFIDNYFLRYPRIRGFIDACVRSARRDGFVRTMLGRRRPIADLDSRNRAARAQAERLAVNTVVQGSAADLIKLAMIRLHERISSAPLSMRMLLQVHDELVCEAPRVDAERCADVVREVMSTAMKLRVPLRVDVSIGENWLEAK
ncbi:MAG: DNA polymerase I [Phycisphaerae bacterium]|jgi:DNA polymerase-1